MKLLFTGKGGAGSWTVRGEQLGAAIGAAVKPMATVRDVRDADLVVVVKRTPPELLAAIRAARRRWVLDVVDFYPQPLAASWSRSEAIGWVRAKIRELQPDAVIWPNARMAQDCDVDLPSMVLYHHHRPGIAENPIREKVQVIGYEGAPAYLAQWRPVLEQECARRGWKFVVNPQKLADLDIVVAFRGGEWDGYAPSMWKSNVKLANAQGSGTPFVGEYEEGYFETRSGGEYFTNDHAGVVEAFDYLACSKERGRAAEKMRMKAYPVQRAAEDLREFLHAL